MDAYIALVDEYNEDISVIALNINKYLKGHNDFKNKEETGKLIDEANKLNNVDSKIQQQLLKCLELEATRIDGLYMGMKNSQDGKEFLPDFKRGSIAAEEFEKEHKRLLRMTRPKENSDEDDLSLGGISLDSTASEVKSKLGEPISSYNDGTQISQAYDEVSVIISKNKVQELRSRSENVETSRGIHINSTIGEAIEAYGKNYSVVEGKDSGTGKVIFDHYDYKKTDKTGNPCELQFGVDHGKDKIFDIVMIRLYENQSNNLVSISQKDKLHPERIKPTVKGGAMGNGYRYFVVTSYVCRYCGYVETLAEY